MHPTRIAFILGLSLFASCTSAQVASLLDIRKTIDRGRPEEALKQLDSLTATKPAPDGIATVRGLALYAANRLLQADEAFAVELAQNPRDEEAAQMRGLVLFRLGRPAEAIPLLESAHSGQAQSKVDPSYVLALCYLDTRRYDDARRAFARQYDFPSESASAYLLASRMLLRREYIPIADQFARKALELNAQIPLAHALLGEIALASQHVDVAISEFEEERKHNPLEPSIYDRLGDAYTRAGDYTLAQQALQRAVLLEPNSTGLYILLGKVMLKREDPIGALTYLEHAEKMDPENFMTHSLLAQAYHVIGRISESERELATAQKIQAASEPKLETAR